MPSRRAYLSSTAAALAALAGCQQSDGGDSTTRTDSETATTTTTATTGTRATTTETTTRVESTEYGERFYYVDGEDGALYAEGTADDPLSRIGAALNEAGPGDTVHVRPGDYREDLELFDGGEPGKPLTLTGPRDAVLRSDDDIYTPLGIHTSHVHVTGLTISGLRTPDTEPTTGDDVWRVSEGQLVQLRPRPDTDEYLRDVKVMPHAIGYSRKALVSIERTKGVEVAGFEVTGLAGAKYYLPRDTGHNAELVYIGTSPSNLGTDWHPWTEYDQTSDVHVHHVDNSAGHRHSELANTKLGTHDVLVEYCTDGGGASNTEESGAAALRFQSFGATARWNVLEDGSGHGVEIASFKARDALEEKADPSSIEQRGGRENALYGNRIAGFDQQAVFFPVDTQTQADQRRVCGNEIEGETHGTPEQSCGDAPEPTGGIGHEGGSFER